MRGEGMRVLAGSSRADTALVMKRFYAAGPRRQGLLYCCGAPFQAGNVVP